VPRSTREDQLREPVDPTLKFPETIPSLFKVSNKIDSLVARTGLTIRETLCYATEHEGEVLRSCTDEDLDERGISLHEAGVHRHPLESHDGLYERHVRAVKTRDDMHEGVKPLSELWNR
jgi:hypothetical protein